MIPSYYPPDNSLYGMYIKERENKDIIESDMGFLTYRFFDDCCIIDDLYIHPEFRKTKIASDMADRVCEIAKSKGYKKLLGSVVPTANNSTDSMKVLLAYGFRLDSSTNNFIVFKKDLV